MDINQLKLKLALDAGKGADLSPGDPVAKAALDEIVRRQVAMRRCYVGGQRALDNGTTREDLRTALRMMVALCAPLPGEDS